MHYNENKLKQEIEIRLNDGSIVKKKKAEFIHASNYGKDAERLCFTDRFKRIEKLAALNERSEKKFVHISLNFDPSEKLSHSTLRQITDQYMAKIGFGNQPYLVYEHHDADHPHIHIVSTNIRQDGSRIPSHNIGRVQSEKARKEIEKAFGLVRAERGQIKELFQLKHETLPRILTQYKYTSIAELNAVLKYINIRADRGGPESRTFKHGGLVYRKIDQNGKPTGARTKASNIYLKPGLKFLDEKFKENEELRQPFKQHIKNAIDFAFSKRPVANMDELIKALKKHKIELVVRENENGIIYGLTYIDVENKCVFNGSDLGKQYSANTIQQRLKIGSPSEQPTPAQKQDPQQIKPPKQKQQRNDSQQPIPFPDLPTILNIQLPTTELPTDGKSILQELTEPEYVNNQIPYELKKQKRKRRRKRHHL